MSARRPVHQLVGALHRGDAVGNEVLALRRILRGAGHASEIVAGWIDPRLGQEARRLTEMPALDDPEAVWLYHFSPGSPATEAALGARGTLALVYHGVTPASFFLRWSSESARLAASAEHELRRLARRTELALAKSRFSLEDLPPCGFRRCAAMPFVHDAQTLPAELPPARAERQARAAALAPAFARLFDTERLNVLFVGRLAPNKRLLELVAAFGVLQRRLQSRSRLLLVGDTGLHAYVAAVLDLARTLRLRDVVLCGRVDDQELQAAYGLADAFVSLSAHEGYGAPLVEAALAGVPVLATAAGAVPETLGGAGLLLGGVDPELVAGAIERLAIDPTLRGMVLARQQRLAARVRRADFGRLALESLAPVLEGADG